MIFAPSKQKLIVNLLCDKDSAETTLDDAVFEEGDEHTQNIPGGPSARMLSLENPEATVVLHLVRVKSQCVYIQMQTLN